MTQPYLSLEAELHDAFWAAEDADSEVLLMVEFLKKFPGPSLEVGSGSGRLMFPLVQMGLDIEGLELSPDMLELGKVRAKQLGVHAVVHAGDMSTWDKGRKFSALLAPAFTLQLAADPTTTLQHWHGLLENHGGLYLTIFMPYAELLGDLPENQWYDDHRVTLPDGRVGLLETRHRLDHAKQLVERDHRYSLMDPIGTNSPQSHQSQQTIRWFDHAEIISLLDLCGFRVDQFFVDFDLTRVVTDPDRIDFDGILTYHATRIEKNY
ncbi:MAG: class I SAM-dependent methyltransferase [Akkermansiaceae bacterium]|nr:class I SAM-dependent methyltransferase [Akkermansiaceae bacterium]